MAVNLGGSEISWRDTEPKHSTLPFRWGRLVDFFLGSCFDKLVETSVGWTFLMSTWHGKDIL